MQFSKLAPSKLHSAVALATLVHGATVLASTSLPEAQAPAWSTPTVEQVESVLLDWLIESSQSEQQAAARDMAARPVLDGLLAGDDRLDAVMSALSIDTPAIAEIVTQCRSVRAKVPALEWLDSADVPYWMRNNTRLYVARSLIRKQHYELGLDVIEGIQPADVFDPASLLFYRAIAEHQLVQVDEAKQTLASLLEANEAMPERFAQIARLMQADIAKVELDSLDHIARRMSDVERRLELGKADQGTQEVERGVLASLDKMIEQLEEQQRQQQQRQQQQQSGGQPSAQPMEDSRIAEMKGDGKVDVKDIGEQAGWGDLPPRERERVLQQIGRDFPGHYRDLMEEYLKRLATDEREPEQP